MVKMSQSRPTFWILYAKKYNNSKKYTTAGCVVGTNMSYAPASPHLAKQLAPATLFTIIYHYHYYVYCHYHYYHPLIIVHSPLQQSGWTAPPLLNLVPPSRPIGGAATEVRTIVFNNFSCCLPWILMDYSSLHTLLLCFQYNRIGLIFHFGSSPGEICCCFAQGGCSFER